MCRSPTGHVSSAGIDWVVFLVVKFTQVLMESIFEQVGQISLLPAQNAGKLRLGTLQTLLFGLFIS
jgi:hypothetical protein